MLVARKGALSIWLSRPSTCAGGDALSVPDRAPWLTWACLLVVHVGGGRRRGRRRSASADSLQAGTAEKRGRGDSSPARGTGAVRSPLSSGAERRWGRSGAAVLEGVWLPAGPEFE